MHHMRQKSRQDASEIARRYGWADWQRPTPRRRDRLSGLVLLGAGARVLPLPK